MNADGLVIRAATELDIPLIRRLADHIWHACYPGIISAEQIDYMLGWMYSGERLVGDLRNGVRLELVELAGSAVGYIGTEREAASGLFRLHKLYLLPECHGRGLGQRLLGHVQQLARDSGCRAVELRVNKSNHRAIRAYERAGFVLREAVVADIGGGFVMDDFILERAV
jgi:ribosomal protein S18 acetylase RimI-like enzyme